MKKKTNTIDDFLKLLDGVRQSGDSYMARCPAHEDTNPSLSIKEADGKILLYCFAGCPTEDVVEALGLEMNDLFLDKTSVIAGGKQPISTDNGSYSVTPAVNQLQNGVTSPALSPVTGVTLEAISKHKCLNPEYLESLGLNDCYHYGHPAIKIPYLDEHGRNVATRYRLTLGANSNDKRFAWDKGNHVMLYGLDSLESIKQQGWLLLVEGESDCWTLWQHGLPALGIPGKTAWQAKWAEYLDGLEVYLWQEPDAEDLALNVLKAIPGLKVIKAPEGVKDISEAHIQGKDIPSFLDELKKTARPGQEIKADLDREQANKLYSKAKGSIESDDPLKLIENEIRRLGYGGDIKPALIVYLAATSRLLGMRNGSMPVHLLLAGPSSSGKSYTLSIVKRLLPPNAYHEIDAGSPRVLIYDNTPLTHKLLIFGEADSMPSSEDNPAASALRNLLQEHHLHYKVVEKDERVGGFHVKTIDKPGPTVLITTSTKPLPHQMSTRLFTLEMSDSDEQIKAGLGAQAKIEEEGGALPTDDLIAMQDYLQLQAPIKVKVPFATSLSKAMGRKNPSPRVLRDFSRILSLIKAVAILRRHHRDIDKSGNIIAAIEDYGTVRELINDMYIDTTGVSDTVRSVVDAVAKLSTQKTSINQTMVAKYLGVTNMWVSRRASKAITQGWLVNNETRKKHPANYEVGEPIPERGGLPTVDEVNDNVITTCNSGNVTVSSFESTECNAVTPIQDSNIPDSDELTEAELEDLFQASGKSEDSHGEEE